MAIQMSDAVRWRRILKLLEHSTAPLGEKLNLSRAHTDVLIFLINNPGLDTARDIVEYRRIPKANVSQAVEQLIRKGLLTRQQDTIDRRHIHLQLTDAALPLARQLNALRSRMEQQMFLGFSPREKEQYQQLSQRLLANLESYHHDETGEAHV